MSETTWFQWSIYFSSEHENGAQVFKIFILAGILAHSRLAYRSPERIGGFTLYQNTKGDSIGRERGQIAHFLGYEL